MSSPDSVFDAPPPFPVPRSLTSTTIDTTKSEAEAEPKSNPSDTSSGKIFHIYHTKPTFNYYSIHDSNKRHVYHVRTSHFTPSKPDLIIHAGPNKKAPIIAVAHFTTFSSSFKIGLGDPTADPRGTVWEDLTQVSWYLRHYKFETEIKVSGSEASAGDEPSERRRFLWKRTSSVGVEEAKPSRLSSGSYKLVDQSTGEIVAVFTENVKAVMKKGKLEIRKDYGPDFQTMVIITGMTVLENQARE
jgi:hypothetical protein